MGKTFIGKFRFNFFKKVVLNYNNKLFAFSIILFFFYRNQLFNIGSLTCLPYILFFLTILNCLFYIVHLLPPSASLLLLTFLSFCYFLISSLSSFSLCFDLLLHISQFASLRLWFFWFMSIICNLFFFFLFSSFLIIFLYRSYAYNILISHLKWWILSWT